MVRETPQVLQEDTYFMETPNWDTLSKPDFHTMVTSQEVVAPSRQARKAEIPLLPTAQTRVRRRFEGEIGLLRSIVGLMEEL